MAGFSENIRFGEEHYCNICRKKTDRGKKIKNYEKYLDCVCDDCYKEYFTDIKHSENDLGVRLRPVSARNDKYGMHTVFVSDIISETIVHILIGAALLLINAMLEFIYSGENVWIFGLFVYAVYAVFSAYEAVMSAGRAVYGAFHGADGKRIILLILKALIFAAIAWFFLYECLTFVPLFAGLGA